MQAEGGREPHRRGFGPSDNNPDESFTRAGMFGAGLGPSEGLANDRCQHRGGARPALPPGSPRVSTKLWNSPLGEPRVELALCEGLFNACVSKNKSAFSLHISSILKVQCEPLEVPNPKP